MSDQTDHRYLPEDAWYAFQEAAYEPDSQQRFESALDTDPDLLDGVLGVVKWAREKGESEVRVLRQQLDAVRRYAEDRAVRGRRNDIVGSARIASDLFQILGVEHDWEAKR